MTYVNWNTFSELYPLEEIISRGTYGNVYRSGDFAVKKMKREYIDPSFVKEIDFSARLKHPCIAQITAWSLDSSLVGYHAIPMGIPSINAVRDELITLETIMSDISSAIYFLHQNDIAHLDIKPENIIVYPIETGYQARLIDFGLSKEAYSMADGRKYFYGPAYTCMYRHPEYDPKRWNPIEYDFYALAKTMYAYFVNDLSPEILLRRFLSFTTDSSEVNLFIQSTVRLKQDLPSSHDLVKDHTVRGETFEPELTVYPHHSGNLGVLLYWLIETGIYFQAKTLFLALDLVHRMLPSILPRYYCDKTERDMLQLLGVSCFILASIVEDDFRISLDKWVYISCNNLSKTQIYSMIKRIMVATNGLIYRKTYWHAARSTEDLIVLLNDMVNGNYDRREIRQLEEVAKDSYRHVFWRDLNRKFLAQYPKKTLEQLWDRIATTDKISFCEIKTIPTYAENINMIFVAMEKMENAKLPNDVYALILNNRHQVKRLTPSDQEILIKNLSYWKDFGAQDIIEVITSVL